MAINFSKFDEPQVLDYAPPPAPRTFTDCVTSIVEFFGGLTWLMMIGGLSLMAVGMMIGSSDETGMMIFTIGFSVLGLLFSAWTFK
jgi:hypothetical protein